MVRTPTPPSPSVPLLLTRVLGFPQSIEIDKTRQEIHTRLFWDPCCSERERAVSLYGVRVRVGSGVRPEGWLRWFAHSFGDVVCRCMHNILLLLLDLQSGSWVFRSSSILLFIIHPNFTSTQLVLVTYSFLEFCCSRRYVARCNHCKGLRSQVPACLTSTSPSYKCISLRS